MSLHTTRFYNHTGYYVTRYFRLAVIEVQRTVENAAFGWNFSKMGSATITKFYMLIADNLPNKPAGYDVLDVPGRLKNEIKYCIKVRKMGPSGQRFE